MSLDNYHISFMKSLYSGDSGVSGNQFSLNNSTTSPTETLSSIFDSFGGGAQSDIVNSLAQLTGSANLSNNSKQMDRLTSSTSISRPNSFNSSLIFSSDFGNSLGAPGTPIGSGGNNQMSVGGVSSQQQQQQLIGATTPTSGGANAPPPKNPKLYKTELCRSWMDHGRCNYGERCQYAHGEDEKRPVPRHPKYKTEACQSFHQSGYCPYGPRCHFIHNEPSTPQTGPAQFQPAAPTTTPVTVNGQPSLYASQYHNMNINKQSSNGGGGGGSSTASSVPSNVLQRVYSLPNGYGSAGESPAGSSNDSGSESPNGSFSPGLDLDETGPFSSGFLTSSPHKMQTSNNVKKSSAQQQIQQSQQQQQQPLSRFLSYDQSNFNDNQFSHLLNDICQWNLDDSLSTAFSASLNASSPWATDDLSSTTTATTPGRLPVFTQLSNPQ